jgi:hypothetical protein
MGDREVSHGLNADWFQRPLVNPHIADWFHFIDDKTFDSKYNALHGSTVNKVLAPGTYNKPGDEYIYKLRHVNRFVQGRCEESYIGIDEALCSESGTVDADVIFVT